MQVNPETDCILPSVVAARYSFGLFEVDFRNLELRRSGLRIRIQDQPLQVLSILLNRPGEIVTRDEFRRALWAADTFVDFDRGLNSAIKRLRHVLGDDPERPRFIETLPRHGYRFIGQLNTIESQPDHQAIHCVTGSAEAGSLGTRLRFSPRLWLQELNGSATIIAVAILAVIAGSALAHQLERQVVPKPSQSKVMLAVLPFKDISSNRLQPTIADGMTEELTTQLGKTNPEELGVIAHTSVEQFKSSEKPITAVGTALGVDYVLEGSVRVEGTRVRISAQLIKITDQTHVWAEVYDRSINDVLELQSDVAQKVTGAVCAALKLHEHRT